MTTRIITAVVLTAFMAATVLWAPLVVFDGVVLLVVMGGLYEFFKLALPPESVYREAGWIWGVAVAASILFFGDFCAAVAVIIGGLFFTALIHMRHATVLEGATARIALTLFGAVYLGATLPFWGLLRMLPHGRALVFLGIASAAMSDTFAFFVGKAVGRRKFAPLTSPNKTLEGFIAGFPGSIFGAWLAKALAWNTLPWPHVIIMGLAIGFIGPFGDLIESLIKRDYHVKDSGHVIPGHGGFLDRLDAMIFVGPFVYFYARLFLL